VSGPRAKQWRPADLLYKALTDGTSFFSIDPYRRTSGVRNATTNVKYLRDHSSRRVSKIFSNGLTIHYVYDLNGQLIAELDGSGATLVEYVWLADTPVAVFQQNSLNYVYADHLNTPRSITDTANVVRWSWRSEPFGSSAANSNPSGKGAFTYNLRFPGQYFDAESGLHYNYFRDYDPQTGRYIQSDPIGLAGGVNTYAYVSGNPISRTDASGLAEYDISIYSSQNPLRLLWNQTSSMLAGAFRGPDYVSVSANIYIMSGGVAMNLHNGNVYKQGSLFRGYPAPSGKLGFCAVAGSILGSGVDGARTDSYLSGAGNQASYFLPAANPFIGVGGGMGHAYGGAYSVEYGVGTPGASVSPATYGWAK